MELMAQSLSYQQNPINMNRTGSIKHFISYIFRDSSNKLLLAFSGFVVCIFIPAMYLVDKSQARKTNFTFTPSWKEASVHALIGLAVIWTIILIYNYVKYRKYISR